MRQPSCGGGASSLFSEFGTIPVRLAVNVDRRMTSLPPAKFCGDGRDGHGLRAEPLLPGWEAPTTSLPIRTSRERSPRSRPPLR